MPSPTNQTALTAMVITTLPFSVTQAVSTEPSTLQLWYTYTAGADDRVLGCVPFANVAGGYLPKLYIYTGPASAPVPYKVFGSQTRACCIPVTPGTVYLFKVIQGGGTTPLGQDLTFILKAAPQLTAAADSVIACEENSLTRAPILGITADNDVRFYIEDTSFMASAQGAETDDGTIIGDGADGGTVDQLSIYDPDLNRVYNAEPSYYGFTPGVGGADENGKFYLGYVPSYPGPMVIRTLTKAGAETSDVWTLGTSADSGNGTGFCPSRDGTKLYYGGKTGTSNTPLHVWDLVGNAALPDLVASIGGGFSIRSNPLVLQDDSILVVYSNTSTDWKILRYSSVGALLNTYDLGAFRFDGMRAALDDPNSFIIKIFDDLLGAGSQCTYRRIKVSDGTTISQAKYDMFANGPGRANYRTFYTTATQVPLFGPAPTCTFFTTRVSIPPTPPPPTTPSGTLILSKVTVPAATDEFTVVNDLINGVKSDVGGSGVGLVRNSGLPSLANFTMMGWWKLPATLALGDIWSFLALLGDDNVFAANYYYLATSDDGLGTLTLEHNDGSITDVTGGTLPLDEWFHLAYTISGTTHKVYLNGVLVINTTFAADVTLTHLFAYIDTLSATVSAFANIKIWERALTITEIAAEKYSTIAIDDADIYLTTPILTLLDVLSDHSGNGNDWAFSPTEGAIVFLVDGYDVVIKNGDLLKFLLTPATYSIVETVLAGYAASYNISTGDPNTAIVVDDGDTVTVVITNAANGSLTIAKLTTPFDAAHVFHLTVNGGLSPGAFDLLSENAQIFADIPAGTYAIAELADTNWFPTFLISNADDDTNDAVVVHGGENVTVIVLNKLQSKYSGMYVLTPDKKTDTLLDQGNAPIELKIPNPFFETGLVGDE